MAVAVLDCMVAPARRALHPSRPRGILRWGGVVGCVLAHLIAPANVMAASGPSPVPDPPCGEQQRMHQAGLVGDAVWPGFYILCVEPAVHNRGTHQFVFSDGSRLATPPPGTDGQALSAFLEGPVVEHLNSRGLRTDDPAAGDPTIVPARFDWSEYRAGGRLFSTDGRPVDVAVQVAKHATVYLFEGGQFLWPGFHVGYERNITVPSELADTAITLRTLSLRPLVFRVKHFLSGQECKHIVKRARKQLRPSMVVQMASEAADASGQGVQAMHQSRTSSNTGLSRGETPTVLRIERRAHEITRLPYELGESLQVVKYEKGQKYEAHRDFFHANDYPDGEGVLNMIDCGARNRLSTLFWYLNTVPEGGETYFPRALNANGTEYNRWNYDFADCYRGLAVKPRQGSGVLFYSMLPNSELDERSLHGGCPPRGESKPKWGANQWTYNKLDVNNGPCAPKQAARSDL
mmetsp:Transcript_8270/g.24553  ORF Transcript_8270/g.24553 Transcript_8270/m.24553 type:complete len:462 (-) Transcript_8270:175-1560(-)